MTAYTKAMSRLILLTSCIIISLCSKGVMAFIPSSTTSSTPRAPSFGLNNLPPLHLKGSSTKHTTIPTTTQQHHIHHTKSSLQATSSSNDNDNNSTNKSSKQTPIKKRKMSISKQSLTPAQKSSTQPPNNNNAADDEQRAYNELMPKTGYSLADSLEQSVDNKELFETVLTPIGGVYSGSGGGVFGDEEREFEYDADGFPIGIKTEQTKNENESEEEGDGHDGIARIDTISNFGGVEPVRWIVSVEDEKDDTGAAASHVMIDLPPYSDKLAHEIRQFMNPDLNTTAKAATTDEVKRVVGTLDAILLTNQQCIHYDNTPGVYVTRKSDLTKWKKAFPEAKVVMYRLDIPRECREEVTQVLDGYGPWGWKEDKEEGEMTFVETGRPLTIEEWDEDTKSRVLENGELPPDDEGMFDTEDGETAVADDVDDEDEDSMYSQEAIRQREEQYRLLAVYTPGHTFGSVTYIFPKRNLCCSGFALPLESSSSVMDDNEDEDDDDEDFVGSSSSGGGSLPPIGPRLDYQGYLATSASRPRQMSSALSLINRYIDRFRVVLPARGDIVFLDSDEEKRKRDLLES
eukprot:CAMPEP_0113385078 /NCGR_PEP_ID=MMETSP0013_2-20120614/7267_1 /TAXON_ID=2843 ORGANISM="Skeletonema costatum, Strain 1716" /NCGR_SAMPLE_ID=MMETSP0013_2 /ASSEMBLY_ACC=CAM_ASM_000158 /LENGTH=573 /DNA_ID=CAMNT_0000267795 /DNA_START=37 /DNA_END=1755 /DNA_ORIENTATION=- /assembly_acc=CAM_ASM_000158